MKAYTSILKSDRGYKHVSASFNVDGKMVGVDFDPIAVIRDKDLQEAIEKDPMFGVNFDHYKEVASEEPEPTKDDGSENTNPKLTTDQSAEGNTLDPQNGVHGTVTTESMKAINTSSIVKPKGKSSKSKTK